MLWIQDLDPERDFLPKEPRARHTHKGRGTQRERLKHECEDHQEPQPLAGEREGLLICWGGGAIEGHIGQ